MICLRESAISVCGAIYRAKSRYPSASAPCLNCVTPTKVHVADCWACDAFGRIDPALTLCGVHPQLYPPKAPVDVTLCV